MSEPIRLYGKDGQEGYAYGQAQRRAMLDSGEWFATAAEAKAAGKGGATVTEPVTEPAPPAAAKATRKGKA